MKPPFVFPFLDVTILMNKWYNTLSTACQENPQTFQLIQPTPVPTSATALWTLQDAIPPDTLKWNRAVYPQLSFFKQYAAIVKALEFPASKFKAVIGAANFKAWENYLKGLPTVPPANTLPTIFLKWAMYHAPVVANAGRSALATQFLIDSAKKNIAAWEGPHAKAIDYKINLTELKVKLKAASSISFSFDSDTASDNVDNTWVPFYSPAYFGIWTDSWGSSSISKKFAKAKVKSIVTINHLTTIAVQPGDWYNSALLHQAYSAKGTPPWPNDGQVCWDDFFGPQGSLPRAMASIVVAAGVQVIIDSAAEYTPAEQSEIQQNISTGSWPFYAAEANWKTTVAFNSAGNMEIKLESAAAEPVILGANVLGISAYLGS